MVVSCGLVASRADGQNPNVDESAPARGDDDRGVRRRSVPRTTNQQNGQEASHDRDSKPPREESYSPMWIWSPVHTLGDIPETSCYFRKTIELPADYRGTLNIAADDTYVAYVNGKKVGESPEGASPGRFTEYDISDAIKSGKNVIAIKVTNREGGTAGLAARVDLELQIDPQKEQATAGRNLPNRRDPRRFVTNPSWRTNLSTLPLWSNPGYRDRRWDAAQSWGNFGMTPSAILGQKDAQIRGGSDVTAKAMTNTPLRGGSDDPANASFFVPEGFEVQHVVGNDQTGSLLAMTFTEFGEILVSRERGPLMRVHDTNGNGVPDAAQVICDKVQSCQGLVCVSGNIYAVGEGPSGLGVYRLEDANHDGEYEQVSSLLRFEGTPGEYGPHGMILGRDGMLYVAFGNRAKPSREFAPTSPHRNYFESDLVPRLEDPNGIDSGVLAPGGGVLRLDAEGETVELVAGGLRNAYDLALDHSGELFLIDSDQETDVGTPWGRNTRLTHVIPGGEYGWRSGSAMRSPAWPDNLPGVLDTGPGAPTGCVFYEHRKLPTKYRGALFTCDWANGTIRGFHLQRSGATFTAEGEVFLKGSGLHPTDIEVGPDGWIYFTTGGRGTPGNLYRVIWRGDSGPEPQRLSEAQEGVRQPQLDSAWGRQAASVARQKLGTEWDFEIRAVVADTSQPGRDRARALELMHLLGPPPGDMDLLKLVQDPEPLVRSTAARLLGLIGNAATEGGLVRMLSDNEPWIRRIACESLVRSGRRPPIALYEKLLATADRFEGWSARMLLEANPELLGESGIYHQDDPVKFTRIAMAGLAARPDRALATLIANESARLAHAHSGESALVDLLRVLELSLTRGNADRSNLTAIPVWLGETYPTPWASANRLLSRLLVGLSPNPPLGRFVAFLDSKAPRTEKADLALVMRGITSSWDPQARAKWLQFLESCFLETDSGNLPLYAAKVAEESLPLLSPIEQQSALARGELMPAITMSLMFVLPEEDDPRNIPPLIALDRRITGKQGDDFDNLRVAIVAILARGGGEDGMAYLRDVYDREPRRRKAVAMGLAQVPEGRNWDYLVRSLPLLDGEPAKEVLTKLKQVPFAPEDTEYFRQLVACAQRMKEDGGPLALDLLEHWVGKRPPQTGTSFESQLAAWKTWCDRTLPAAKDDGTQKIAEQISDPMKALDEVQAYLEGPLGKNGSVTAGRDVFVKAGCAQCHVHGEVGEPIGPDLSQIADRQNLSALLASVMDPSREILPAYRTIRIKTQRGDILEGFIQKKANDLIVITDREGAAKSLFPGDIKEQAPSDTSLMPPGLVDSLTMEEIAHLVAFLRDRPTPTAAMEDPISRK